MKKRFLVLLLIAVAMSVVFSLAACELLGIGGGGGQAPTFKSMTVYSPFGGSSDTFAYAEPYQDVYITIQLENPDELTIAVVVVSGKEYQAASFESESDKKTVVVVKTNVIDSTGIVTYTLDSVKYVDGKNLKEVDLSGNPSVKVGICQEDQVAAFVTEKIGFTDVTLTIDVKDDNGLIAMNDGYVKVELRLIGELIEEKTLAVGRNEVTFEGLDIDETYGYTVSAYFNDFNLGLDTHKLHANIVRTKALVKFKAVESTYDGAEFTLDWHEDAPEDCSVKEVHVIDGDKDVKMDDASANKVTGRLSGRDYTLVVYFDYNGKTYNIARTFHTRQKSAPEFFCSNLWVAEDEIRFDFVISDLDNAGALVTTLNGQEVTPTFIKNIYTKDQIAFSHLTYGQTYKIDMSYNYDLNDGEGVHPLSKSYTVTIDSKTIHLTSCKLNFTLTNDNTFSVGKNSTCTHAVLEIPSSVDDLPVTKVGNFSNSSNLTSVILPDTVTEFVNSAFANCKNLTSVNLPQNLSVLGKATFSGCEALTGVVIPTTVTEIPDETFNGCTALTSIEIPANVETIGKKVFVGSGLQTLTFAAGSKLATIGDEAFYELTQLTELTIPASVKRIFKDAFSYCTRLQDLTFAEGSQLYSIGDSAFYRCTALSEVNLPSQLYSIGDRAFVGCDIINITIPASVYSIGSRAFASSVVGGGGLQEVIFEPNCDLTRIGDEAFSDTALTELTIPKSVFYIGAKAFYRCKSLVRLNFEDDSELRTIGDSAFAEISNLRFVNIPAKVERIGNSAFAKCGLSTVTFDNGSHLEAIGDSAFAECSFYTISIPASVISIGGEAFRLCRTLRDVVFAQDCKLQTIGASAFSDCGYLATISIPASLVTLGDKAFQNSGLATINYATDGNLATIGAYAFEGCKITRIFIPKSVVTIGEGAYKGFGNIAAITIEDGTRLQTIGAYAFEGLAITQVTIPRSVTTIGSGAFKNCSSLSAFTFEDGSQLQNIGAHFFEGCDLIAEIVIPRSVTSIGEGAFKNLVNLRSVQFEEGSQLQTIGASAFEGCSSLPNIILPEGLVEIQGSAFYDCSVLEWVVLPKTIATIGATAIEYSRHSVTIYYLGSYTQWCQDVTFSFSPDRNHFQILARDVYFRIGDGSGKPSWSYRNGVPTPNA